MYAVARSACFVAATSVGVGTVSPDGRENAATVHLSRRTMIGRMERNYHGRRHRRKTREKTSEQRNGFTGSVF